jgi:hypothetical protein
MQTVIPELYYIRGGIPSRLAPIYTAFMRAGPDGLPREITSRIDPIKMIGRAFSMMRNPDPEFREALDFFRNSGVIDPRFKESFVGADANFPNAMRGEMGKPNGILRVLKMINSIPEKAEGLSRIHASAVGWQVGRHVLGLDPGQARLFTKEFINRTMYGYGVADRSRIFTGPFGSAFGCSKTGRCIISTR